jgi:hypothetical protein
MIEPVFGDLEEVLLFLTYETLNLTYYVKTSSPTPYNYLTILRDYPCLQRRHGNI